jgi:predicted acyltransferase
MIFVNELAGVQDIPAWMKHMPADADAMTFVDVVFPAFLFIVGMSIPFAISNRLSKGDNVWQLQLHILFRTLGLLVLGVFMVNAEGGYNEAVMGMSIYAWSLLFYVGIIMIWNVYTIKNKAVVWTLRALGIALLVVLAYIYRGSDGASGLTPQWWGILGLIGWAYLVASVLYQLSGKNIFVLPALVVICLLIFVANREGWFSSVPVIGWLTDQAGHAIHTMIVLCGIIVSRIFFGNKSISVSKRFQIVLAFTLILLITGYLLRPPYAISKIYATPTWALYSAAICSILFAFFYWLIDLRKISHWTGFIKPAGSNPLLTYIIPFIVYAVMHLLQIAWPAVFYQGVAGILWSLVYAIAVMALVIGLNRLKIRLQL